jgi:hypothetical protein
MFEASLAAQDHLEARFSFLFSLIILQNEQKSKLPGGKLERLRLSRRLCLLLYFHLHSGYKTYRQMPYYQFFFRINLPLY